MLTSKLEAVVIPIWNCRGLFLSEGRIKKGLINESCEPGNEPEQLEGGF